MAVLVYPEWRQRQMTIQYMDDGFAPHVDRGLASARLRLDAAAAGRDQGGEAEKHSRALVEHILALEPERVPAVTAELFAEAIAVANAVRQSQEDLSRLSVLGTFGRF
jgi:hypothetical protein